MVQVVVVGVEDEVWGQLVAAVIVLRPGHTLDIQQLKAPCLVNIAGME